MKNKILGIMLIIAIMLVVIIPIIYAAEEVVNLDLGYDHIIITPTGYWGWMTEWDEEPYTGTYNITGSGILIDIENYSNSEVTFDISLDKVVLLDGINIWGNSDIVLNLKIYGDTYIELAFRNGNTGSTTVNISIEEGALYLPTYSLSNNIDFDVSDLCIYVDGYYTIYRNGHEAGEAVTENEVKATCTEEGGYDKVVYCSVCDEELSREFVETETATGHVEGEVVKENEIEATTENEGSYDEVVYCQVCGEELSRTTVEVAYVTEETVDGTYENIDTENEETESVTEEVTETENETTSNPITGDTIVVFAVVFVIAVAGIVVTIKMRKRAK